MKIHTFFVKGTHCHACKILIEDVLSEQPGVEKVCVNLSAETVTIESTTITAPEEVVEDFSQLLAPHKYELLTEKHKKNNQLQAVAYAIPLGLFILGLFFLFQKSGIVNFSFEAGLRPITPLLIGVIASLSTCLAVVGGLVLSLSAKISQDGATTTRPFLFFHGGRVVGFTVLGGLLGAVGSAITINSTVNTILGLFVAFVMIILGLNLLDLFRVTKRFQLVLPRHFFDRLTKIENGFFAPFIVGAGTFFLPCGFTQSMQLAALSSGSVWSGSMIMGVFALGTLPMLSLISFGSFRFAHTRYAPLFFKTAGVVVIGLGLFSFLSLLAGLGIIKPLFTL